MISVIITARDIEKKQLQRAVDCVKDNVGEVLVIDYGSKKPVKLDGCTVFRYDKNPIWNKSHAINFGIKKSKGDIIMNLDADILLSPNVINKIKKFANEETFIYDTNVRRINKEDIGSWGRSWDWNESSIHKINSTANGGIQVFPRSWIEVVRGYDEDLILWGAEDNDIFNRAALSSLTMINLNLPIYHVEHNKNRGGYDEKQLEIANFIRKEKSIYIRQKVEEGKIIGNIPWGEETPNQSKYIKLWTNWEEEIEKLQKKREKNLEKIKQIIIKSKLPIKKMDVTWNE